jgi:hypothetical protein
MQVHTSQLSIKKFKRSSIRRAPTNQSRSLKFLRRPHFVRDFVCRRSCFNLQLSSESSCKAPSFYIWKKWGRSSNNFCDCYVFRVCSRFKVLFRGGGSKICGKISWIGYWGLYLGFRRKTYTGWSTSPDSVPTSCFYSKLLRSDGERKPLYWATIPLGFDRKK